MSRYLYVIICLVGGAASSTARADRKAILRSLVFAAPAIAHQVIVHESSHALTALARDSTVVNFSPYPHRINGRWYMGYMSYLRSDSPRLDTAVTMAPYAIDVLAFAASDIALSYVRPKSWGGTLLLVMGMAAPLFDFTVNYIRGTQCGDDWGVLRDRSPAFGIVGGVLIGVGVLRLAYRTVQAIRDN